MWRPIVRLFFKRSSRLMNQAGCAPRCDCLRLGQASSNLTPSIDIGIPPRRGGWPIGKKKPSGAKSSGHRRASGAPNSASARQTFAAFSRLARTHTSNSWCSEAPGTASRRIHPLSLPLKILNSSSKSEIIRTAERERLCIDDHLPGSLEYCRRAEALPISYVKRAVHIRQPAIPLHCECSRLVHFNHSSVCDGRRLPPRVRKRFGECNRSLTLAAQ